MYYYATNALSKILYKCTTCLINIREFHYLFHKNNNNISETHYRKLDMNAIPVLQNSGQSKQFKTKLWLIMVLIRTRYPVPVPKPNIWNQFRNPDPDSRKKSGNSGLILRFIGSNFAKPSRKKSVLPPIYKIHIDAFVMEKSMCISI